MQLIITYYNTLVDSTTVTCYNYKKDNYFTLSYLELKNLSNIKEIKENTSKELRKEEP